MRILLATILTTASLLAAPAMAQQPVATPQQHTQATPELLQNYYNNCVTGTSDPAMTQQTKAAFCQCTAQQIGQKISVQELANAGTNPAIQQKILLDVYAPCMQYPVQELIFNQCRTQQQLAANPAICPCVAKHMAAHTAKTAQSELANAIKNAQGGINPFNAILESPQAKQEQQRIAIGCISGAIN